MHASDSVDTVNELMRQIGQVQDALRSGGDRKTVLEAIREARRMLNDLERDLVDAGDGVLGDAT